MQWDLDCVLLCSQLGPLKENLPTIRHQASEVAPSPVGVTRVKSWSTREVSWIAYGHVNYGIVLSPACSSNGCRGFRFVAILRDV
jgi:hypothetical protein